MPRCRWLTYLIAVVLFSIALPLGLAQGAGFYYQVQQGDSINALSGRFGVSQAELMRANRLSTGSRLVPGSRLWIPGGGPARQAPAAAPAPRSPALTPAPAPQTRQSASRESSIPPGWRARPEEVAAAAAAPAPAASGPSASDSVYVVQRGDSLWKIANQHKMTVDQLAALNGLDRNRPLEVGQRLRVSGASPAPAVEDIPGGGIELARQRAPEPAPSAPTSPPSSARPSRQGFIWPVEGRVIRTFVNNSQEKYTGIDIAVPEGTEIRAARDGKVTYAGDTIRYYGNMVIISHDGGLSTCYAQTARILVRKGQEVKRGQVIARSGRGKANNEPYLHFEIRRGGDAVNPIGFLP